jgi:hypothetical protein
MGKLYLSSFKFENVFLSRQSRRRVVKPALLRMFKILYKPIGFIHRS